MDNEQIIGMWTSNVLLDYAVSRCIGIEALSVLTEQHEIIEFLTINYELLHLYPDNAVFEEIDQELARNADA